MQEVGGNARLILPEQRRVKTSEGEIAGQVRCLIPQRVPSWLDKLTA